jgi:hypothetical protein
MAQARRVRCNCLFVNLLLLQYNREALGAKEQQ